VRGSQLALNIAYNYWRGVVDLDSSGSLRQSAYLIWKPWEEPGSPHPAQPSNAPWAPATGSTRWPCPTCVRQKSLKNHEGWRRRASKGSKATTVSVVLNTTRRKGGSEMYVRCG